MCKVTEKMRSEIRNTMFEKEYTTGTRISVYVCPECGYYTWYGTTVLLDEPCLFCDTDTGAPVLMSEEEMTL